MGPNPRHQRRCRSRPRSRPPGCLRAPGGPLRGGAIAYFGGYSNSTGDLPINHTLTSNNMQTMYSWQAYLPAQLPMIWQPQADYRLHEIANDLLGATPLSPTLSGNPENWYLVN